MKVDLQQMQHAAIDFLNEETGRNSWAEYSCDCCEHSLFHMFDENLNCHHCGRSWSENRHTPTSCPNWMQNHQKRLKIQPESSNGEVVLISRLDHQWSVSDHTPKKNTLAISPRLTLIDAVPIRHPKTNDLEFLAMSNHTVLCHPTNAKQLPNVKQVLYNEFEIDRNQRLPLILLDQDRIIITKHQTKGDPT